MPKTINTRTKHKIVGSDYSAQEPRMSCFLSSEPAMYDAYMNGKDLYAKIAASALDLPYEECLEFYPEGYELDVDGKKVICGHKTHLNKHGKANRSIGKGLNLAATYGMGAATAGANMGKTTEEGQKLLDNFFAGFPKLAQAIEDSKKFLRENGYVEDFLGRRRRLPEINLPKYMVALEGKKSEDSVFNPILICGDRQYKDPKVLKWEREIQKAISDSQAFNRKRAEESGTEYKDTGEMSNKKFEALQKEAKKDGVYIQANTGRIAQAERQCFNARIQGSAASLTKIAMVDIFYDKILNDCKAKLIIQVHDELLVECPAYYADIVEKRLPEVMVAAAKRGGDDVPQACDPYNVTRWYAEVASATIQEEFKKLEKDGMSRDEALAKVIVNHEEIPEYAIVKAIETGCDLDFD